jgi:hypothetical protein
MTASDLQKIVEALRPLARMADQVDEWQAGVDPRVEFSFDAGDLRRAREALALAERMQAEAGKAAKEAKDLAWSLRTRAAKDAVRYGGMGYYSKGDALLDIKAADEIERLSRELEAAKAGGKAA